ncbi:hypothetical protein QQS21_007718 [Conoideocrella luteorostrata]|uniref:2EXR domain-containing protein n=1 Tax=Conoideocrella luteorostrata TaxID=1105319 RepID=A0AAJ0CML3_9HYPO|nr:hypothetical protein QQS21_007718 [Conoideocrella luteorostrata]
MARFPSFARLPIELQQTIWEATIPAPCATAYPAKLTIQAPHRNEDGSIGANSKCRAHLHNAAKIGPAKSGFISTLSSLLLCCKAASDAATAAYQRHKTDSPMSLRGLRHEINARRDLLMLQQGWQSQCHRLATSVRYIEPQRTLHNLAIVWPGPETKEFYGFNALMNLLSLWKNLQALYVVVDPGYLEAKPWIPDEDRCWDNGYNGCLSTFLDTYGLNQSPHEPSVFYDGDRVYYEVGGDVLAKAGGLEQAAELLFVAQKELNETYEDEEEEPPIKCMILSWKHM